MAALTFPMVWERERQAPADWMKARIFSEVLYPMAMTPAKAPMTPTTMRTTVGAPRPPSDGGADGLLLIPASGPSEGEKR